MGSRSVLSKTQSFTLFIDNCLVNFSTQVKSLGVIFDGLLSFGSHISNISRSAFYNLRNIARLLHFLKIVLKCLFMHWLHLGLIIAILF